MSSTLLVIGAGPKAIAIAAKAAALRRLGVSGVPDLVVIEKQSIAANWTGKYGFTDGGQSLGTPPEKDIGFPYRSTEWGGKSRDVDDAMLAYSWSRYKVLAEPSEPFAAWIDRGRPQPTHADWSGYLDWVARQVAVDVRPGEVKEIGIENGEWKLIFRDHQGEAHSLKGAGLVITGPGRVPDGKLPPGCFNPVSFWGALETFEGKSALDVCVVGAGETAAAVVGALLDRLDDDSRIFVVSPHGFIYSRGENYLENRIYTDPFGWEEISEKDRREFIRRTDRGVFSQAVQEKINTSRISVRCLPGRVKLPELQASPRGVFVSVDYSSSDAKRHEFDFVVDAARLDRLWFTDLMTEPVRQKLEECIGVKLSDSSARQKIEGDIDVKLRLQGFSPNLHLPMLSALSRGPGFPNLSCLGTLSDRILKAYLT